MRLCIPTTNDGLNASVSEHFGSAQFFTIYDSKKGEVEIIDDSQQNHIHGACQPMMALRGKKIDAVVCGGMGPRAVQKLNDSGIKIYKSNVDNVEGIIKKIVDNDLKEIDLKDACEKHKCK